MYLSQRVVGKTRLFYFRHMLPNEMNWDSATQFTHTYEGKEEEATIHKQMKF
jgi:hypothetical protein